MAVRTWVCPEGHEVASGARGPLRTTCDQCRPAERTWTCPAGHVVVSGKRGPLKAFCAECEPDRYAPNEEQRRRAAERRRDRRLAADPGAARRRELRQAGLKECGCGAVFKRIGPEGGVRQICSACRRARYAAWKHATRDRREEARVRRPNGVQRVKRLIEKRKPLCYSCHTWPATDVDHVIPLSRGGDNGEGNLAPACHFCNSRKAHLFLVEWRRRSVRKVAEVAR